MEKYKGKTDEDGKKNLIEQAKEAKKLEIMISKTCNKIKQERDISKQMNHFEEIINLFLMKNPSVVSLAIFNPTFFNINLICGKLKSPT